MIMRVSAVQAQRAILIATIVGVLAAVPASHVIAGVRAQEASVQPRTPSAVSDVYTCTPFLFGVFTARVHVRCTIPYNGTIYYFAVCTVPDSANASRVLSAFTTAEVTGKNVLVYFNPNDTSGVSCGCAASDCRLLTGVEPRDP